mmetsp:Transcript_32450/g.48592  ORF Transcript_32450/g.48592 Transcript_32450/m.48592 type:complete len:134 (+) Transcript_32450:586-987(+)
MVQETFDWKICLWRQVNRSPDVGLPVKCQPRVDSLGLRCAWRAFQEVSKDSASCCAATAFGHELLETSGGCVGVCSCVYVLASFVLPADALVSPYVVQPAGLHLMYTLPHFFVKLVDHDYLVDYPKGTHRHPE